MNNFDIIIVGGGASGIMTAIVAAQNNKKVAIIDAHSFVGKKLLATGNGHCNLSNLNMNSDYYNQNIDAFLNRFNQFQTIKFFEKIGLVTKADTSGRIYPFSNDAKTVLQILSSKLKELGVSLFTNCQVTAIQKDKNSFSLTAIPTPEPNSFSKNFSKNSKNKVTFNHSFSNASSPKTFSCTKLILASGGSQSFPFSTNFPVQFAPTFPSLAPLKTLEKTKHLSGIRLSDVHLKAFVFSKNLHSPFPKDLPVQFAPSSPSPAPLKTVEKTQHLSGIRLSDVQLKSSIFPENLYPFSPGNSIRQNFSFDISQLPAEKPLPTTKKMSKEEFGEILFKDQGISGIAALNISTIFARNHSFHGKVFIDMAPKMTEIDLKTLLNNRKSLRENILSGFLNDFIAKEVFNRLNLNFNAPNSQLTGKDIANIAHIIKNFEFTVCGNYANNQVVSGGVPLSALNENLESKTIKNLYFCGELVDVDGESGGYNLQWAWTSAHIVGNSL